MITAKRTTHQKLVTRNSSFFKKLPNPLEEAIQESSPQYLRWNYKPFLILMGQNPLNTVKCQLRKKSFVKLPQVKPALWKTTTCLLQWNNHPHHYLPASLAVEGESGNQNGPRTMLWTKDFAMTISWALITLFSLVDQNCQLCLALKILSYLLLFIFLSFRFREIFLLFIFSFLIIRFVSAWGEL